MKLLTKELEKKFEEYPLYSQDGKMGDAKVIAKFFNPIGQGTWLITEGDIIRDEKGNIEDVEMFGFVNLIGMDCAELGAISLNELQNLKLPYGMGIERDLYFPKDINLRDACKREFGYVPEMFKEKTTVTVLQLKHNDKNHKKRFMSLEYIVGGSDSIQATDYESVFSEKVDYCDIEDKAMVSELLEKLYSRYNNESKPEGYKGYSLSVSDVIILRNGQQVKSFYCDNIGFSTLSEKFSNEYFDKKLEDKFEKEIEM